MPRGLDRTGRADDHGGGEHGCRGGSEGTDAVTGAVEIYDDRNKTLTITEYTINGGNSGRTRPARSRTTR